MKTVWNKLIVVINILVNVKNASKFKIVRVIKIVQNKKLFVRNAKKGII